MLFFFFSFPFPPSLCLLLFSFLVLSCSFFLFFFFIGYARSDRLSKKRTTIAAADVAKILVSMGVDRVVCVELHAGQIEGFFGGNVAVDDLDSTTTFVAHLPQLLRRQHFPNSLITSAASSSDDTTRNQLGICVVSPDAGGVARAKRFRTKCESMYGGTPGWEPTSLAIIVKQVNHTHIFSF